MLQNDIAQLSSSLLASYLPCLMEAMMTALCAFDVLKEFQVLDGTGRRCAGCSGEGSMIDSFTRKFPPDVAYLQRRIVSE
jgi:hypothetical protein